MFMCTRIIYTQCIALAIAYNHKANIRLCHDNCTTSPHPLPPGCFVVDAAPLFTDFFIIKESATPVAMKIMAIGKIFILKISKCIFYILAV